MEARSRLPQDRAVSSLNALELLEIYWKANQTRPDDMEILQKMAADVIRQPGEL